MLSMHTHYTHSSEKCMETVCREGQLVAELQSCRGDKLVSYGGLLTTSVLEAAESHWRPSPRSQAGIL